MITCKWLLTSSLVRPSTCMISLICFGVAAANWMNKSNILVRKFKNYDKINDISPYIAILIVGEGRKRLDFAFTEVQINVS